MADQIGPSVDVPARALVRCPKERDGKTFSLVRVTGCLGCEKFGGLEDRFPGNAQQSFAVRFSVRCYQEPVRREIALLAE